MTVSVAGADLRVLDLETRMPFHFGGVEVTEIPKAILELEVDLDGGVAKGTSMGGLIPGWFYKDPDMPLDVGLRNMITAFRAAVRQAGTLDPEPTAFDFWRALYDSQREWAAGTAYPPLLWTYGVSLVEQALIDAVCRHVNVSFVSAVHEGLLGIDLGAIYDELEPYGPSDLLPRTAERSTAIRHTVGIDDPLTAADVGPGERLADGLPQTLAEYIRSDGVNHFKIKLAADGAADRARLARIAEILEEHDVEEYRCTLDANEGYDSASAFKRQWEGHAADPALAELVNRLEYVEQPLARDDAFTRATKEVLDGWDDAPPVIIDESDDRIDSAGTAMEYGYAGTSHKNCKGVFKGIVNACLVAYRNRTETNQRYVLSAEDLTTVGPIELLQDLAVVATVGAGHVERNGHHYFRGLDAFPEAVQETVLRAHGDLYRRHEDGFPTLDIDDGTVDLASVVEAPFGVAPLFDLDQFQPVDRWLDDLDA